MDTTDAADPNRALDALLAGYAAGTLGPFLHVLVASHLVLRPENRRFVRNLEAAGGAELEEAPPLPLRGRDERLAAILGDAGPRPVRPSRGGKGVLPPPLADLLGSSVEGLRWRWLVPGVRRHLVEARAGTEAALFWIKAGRKTYAHTHEGSEVTLVLAGGIKDVTGHFRRGDISIADPDVDHRPATDPDEDCLCFTVAEAPRRLTGPVGRRLQQLIPGRRG